MSSPIPPVPNPNCQWAKVCGKYMREMGGALYCALNNAVQELMRYKTVFTLLLPRHTLKILPPSAQTL